ncbi:MAG: hypothetical protein KDD61_15635 [Bdellovibrionales bacterium]|nr:hypothetical protein [Bdellovibrionales bacterium]
MKTLYLLVAILGFLNPAFALTELESSPQCEGSWVFHQYSVCENPNKPIPALGDNPAYCPQEYVIAKDYRCPKVFPECADMRHGVENYTPVTIIPRDSGWMSPGHTPEQGCQRALNLWTIENKDPLLIARVSAFTGENTKKTLGFPSYLYKCNLEILKGEPKVQASSYCGLHIGYQECLVKVVKPCMHTAFATEFEKERNANCRLEDNVAFSKDEYSNLTARQDVAEMVNCTTCDDYLSTEDLNSYVRCIYQNYVDYALNSDLLPEKERPLLKQKIEAIMSDEESRSYLTPFEQTLLKGVLSADN